MGQSWGIKEDILIMCFNILCRFYFSQKIVWMPIIAIMNYLHLILTHTTFPNSYTNSM